MKPTQRLRKFRPAALACVALSFALAAFGAFPGPNFAKSIALPIAIKNSLPAGTPRADVVRFLDKWHVQHSGHDDDPAIFEGEAIQGIVRDTSYGFIVAGDMTLYFGFDTANKLVKYSLERGGTGP